MLYFPFVGLFLMLTVSVSWCEPIEQIVVPLGDSFSFDCQNDESVYFTRQLHDWTEIKNNYDKYLHLNLNFIYLNRQNILRVISDSAYSQNIGYYGCRKPTSKSNSMNRIYQIVVTGK